MAWLSDHKKINFLLCAIIAFISLTILGVIASAIIFMMTLYPIAAFVAFVGSMSVAITWFYTWEEKP